MIGPEHAHTLLRQSVRYCVKSEREWNHTAEPDKPRVLLPKLLDQYHLVGKPLGTKAAEDGWVDRMSKTIFEGTPEQAAEAAAAALAEGMAPDAVGEAIALAANQLVLRDAGRTAREVQPNKPLGSVHGDSIGVHACDSANAWRNMARAANPRNTVACLILGAYQVAYDRVNRGGDFLHWSPRPLGADLDPIKDIEPAKLLAQLDAAIRAGDQARACAVTHRIGTLDQPARPVFDLLLNFAVSEDGALHAEKFYRTVSEEFASTRAAFRWRQLVALLARHRQRVRPARRRHRRGPRAAADRLTDDQAFAAQEKLTQGFSSRGEHTCEPLPAHGSASRKRLTRNGIIRGIRTPGAATRAAERSLAEVHPADPLGVGLDPARADFRLSYTVEPHEQAVVLRFGKYHATTMPGLHFKMPMVNQVMKVSVEEHGLRLPFGLLSSGENADRVHSAAGRRDPDADRRPEHRVGRVDRAVEGDRAVAVPVPLSRSSTATSSPRT